MSAGTKRINNIFETRKIIIMSRRGHKKPNAIRSNCLAVDQWPESDRTLWHRARHAGDVLEVGGRAASWAPRTVKNVEEVYGKWLKWMRD